MTVVAVRTRQGHTLIGGYDELRAHLVAAAAAGQLTRDGLLDQGVLPDGRCYARVRLLAPPPLKAAPRRRVRRGVAIAGVVAVALAVAGWLSWLAVMWVAAHVWQIAAVMLLAGLALIALGQVGVCPGVHCPGCRHR